MLFNKKFIRFSILILILFLYLSIVWAQNADTKDENIYIKGIINFDFDKSDIRPEAIPFLNRVYQKIIEFPDSKTQLIGHTCSMGPAQYNIGLSYRRANSVLNYFVNTKKLPKDRFYKILGYGETRPIASNSTREGRAKNRRVEITTYKAGYTPNLPPIPKQQLGDVGFGKKPTLFGSILIYRYEREVGSNLGDLGGERRLIVAYGLSNGVVELSNASGSDLYRRITNENGDFDFGELNPDYWTLEPYKDYLPQNHHFTQDKISFQLTNGMRKQIIIRVVPDEYQIAEQKTTVKEGEGFGLKQGNAIISRFNINFDFGSSEISSEKEPILEFVYEVINQFPDSKIQLEGHTDNLEAQSDSTNLSYARAKKVLDFFTDKKNVPKERFNQPMGFGDTHPVAFGDTDEAHSKNRRVEIIIYKSEYNTPK